MKIATWNLQRPSGIAAPRTRRILKEIERVNADIWVLTETIEGLGPSDSHGRAYSGASDRPGRPSERWIAIWSRFPIVEQYSTSDSARTAAVRIAPPGVAEVIVYGTVLPWIGSAWNKISGKGGAAFSAAVDVQKRDWARLSTKHKQLDLVVAGDLNQDFSDKHYYGSKLNRAVLTNALTEVRLRVAAEYPNDPVPNHAHGRASIDHICVPVAGPRWERMTLSSWPAAPAPDLSLSDHFGLSLET